MSDDSNSVENSKSLWNLLNHSEKKLDTAMVQLESLISERKKNHEKINALKKRLKADTKVFIESLESISSLMIKGDKDYCKKVSKLSKALCTELGMTNSQLNNADILSRLHLTGLLFSKDSEDKFVLNPQKSLFLFSNASMLKKISSVFCDLDEFFDGSGPLSRKGKKISKEVRVVRCAAFYYYLFNKGKKSREIIELLDAGSGKSLDPEVVSVMYKVLMEKDFFLESDIIALGLDDLKPGMTLVSGVFLRKGAMLLPSGTLLDDEKIKKIVSYNEGEAVADSILIRR